MKAYLLLLNKHEQAAGRMIELVKSPSTIGRAEDCEIVINTDDGYEFIDENGKLKTTDGTVSRRHAQFTQIGNVWIITDIGSRNGTAVNNKRVQSAELHDGDTISLSALKLRFLEKTSDTQDNDTIRTEALASSAT